MLPRFCAALSILHPLFPPLLALLYLPFSLSLCLSTFLSLFFLIRFSPSLFFFVLLFFLLSLSATYFSLFLPYPSLTRYHTQLSLSLLLPFHLSPSLSCDSATELAILQIVTASYRHDRFRGAFLFFENCKNFLSKRKKSNSKSFTA